MMNSSATLPHAAALAQELETELQRLDALQELYAQLLVHQLSSLDFPGDGAAATMVAAMEPTSVHSGGYVAAKPQVTVVTARIKPPSTLPLPGRHQANNAARVLQPPHRHRFHPVTDTINGSSSPPQRPSPTVSEPPPLPPPPKLRDRSAAMTGMHRSNAGARCYTLPRQQRYAAATPVAPVLHKDEVARRARRALRLIREERDAHFNAKARRAEELLREGREAAQKSRARRQAEMAQSLPNSR